MMRGLEEIDHLCSPGLAWLVCDQNRPKSRRRLNDTAELLTTQMLVDRLHMEVEDQVEVHLSVLSQDVTVAGHAISGKRLAGSRLTLHVREIHLIHRLALASHRRCTVGRQLQ